MRYYVTVEGQTVGVDVLAEGVQLDGKTMGADLEAVPGTPVKSLVLDGTSYRLAARRIGKGDWELQLDGRRFRVRVLDDREHTILQMTGGAATHTGPRPVRAPMPGLVVRVEVEEGEVVEAGQGLVIVEAMKMENELKAEAAGRIGHIRAQAGEAVEKDQVLVEFEPVEEDVSP